MNGELGRRQTEDQPAVPDVDVRQLEDVAKHRAVGLGVGAVDDRVCAVDHGRGRRQVRNGWSQDDGHRPADGVVPPVTGTPICHSMNA